MRCVICSPAAGRLGRRVLHTTSRSLASTHPRITTHPSVVPRDKDPRWEGVFMSLILCHFLKKCSSKEGCGMVGLELGLGWRILYEWGI